MIDYAVGTVPHRPEQHRHRGGDASDALAQRQQPVGGRSRSETIPGFDRIDEYADKRRRRNQFVQFFKPFGS
jgi:hypothetical protein